MSLRVANLFTSTLTDIGLGKDSYEDIQKYQSSITGGISASFVTLPNMMRVIRIQSSFKSLF